VIPVFTIGRRAVPLVRELSLSPRVHLPGARAAPLRRFPPGGRRAACGICGIPLGPLALPGGRLTVSRGASLILGACRFAAAAPKLYARAEARNLWVAQGQPAGSASTKRRMPHLLRRESKISPPGGPTRSPVAALPSALLQHAISRASTPPRMMHNSCIKMTVSPLYDWLIITRKLRVVTYETCALQSSESPACRKVDRTAANVEDLLSVGTRCVCPALCCTVIPTLPPPTIQAVASLYGGHFPDRGAAPL
jgi:hypothetical protein